jgi:hypothetical protein
MYHRNAIFHRIIQDNFTPGKEQKEPFEQEARWAPQSAWML